MTAPTMLLLALVLLMLGVLLLRLSRTHLRVTADEERTLAALPTADLTAEGRRLWELQARRQLLGAKRTGARLYLIAGVLMLTCALLVLAMALTLTAVSRAGGPG